jgi:EAL domain-containing protein (putative c-di-GMP-specific phosphodiesterase class I)/DNA-binding NarL/FixJ family response regulator
VASAADLNFLVVEDDEFQRRWIGAVVANLGAGNIAEAGDGAAALEILKDKTRRIDITFIDLSLPGMDGLELIRHIAAENHPTSVVLVSALDSSLLLSIETMATAYGVDTLGAIEKPATPEAVQSLIDAYVAPNARRKKSSGDAPDFSFGELQQALKSKEFEPLFQPKVELATGQLKGVEAFVRWRHPQYGLLAPTPFIPMLEENGEMDALTWIVVEKSLAAWRTWREQGLSIAVSINLSPSTLAKPGMANRLIEQVLRQGGDPHSFIVEITESAAVTNVPYFLENLARLRMRGFGLSVDDYGGGHASMQELMHIPFTELKIDRSFVTGASHNQALEMVLSSSLEICQRLNRYSVVVGVETQQDWDFLHQRGCTFAQGFYIAKPMEAGAIPEWAREWAQFF